MSIKGRLNFTIMDPVQGRAGQLLDLQHDSQMRPELPYLGLYSSTLEEVKEKRISRVGRDAGDQELEIRFGVTNRKLLVHDENFIKPEEVLLIFNSSDAYPSRSEEILLYTTV